MPEQKIKIHVPGLAPGPIDAFDVPILESTERWTEIKLEDGSVLRTKPVVIGAVRIEGHYDPEGNPMYSLKINQVMTVAGAPAHLRKGGSDAQRGVH